jgi:hypothetical protein
MQLFRRKLERNTQSKNQRDIAMFTSLENKNRFLSEGR